MKKRRVKFLSALLALSMVLALLPVTAFAATVTFPNNYLNVRDKDGKKAYSADLTETILDMGGEQKVYVYPEGTTYSAEQDYIKITEIKNLTTGKTVPAGDSFTPPKDGCVYRISYSQARYSESADEYVTYVKCNDWIPVPGSKALLSSNESTGTTKMLRASSNSSYETDVLLYPAGTVFLTMSGREIYDVDTIDGTEVANKPKEFVLPEGGAAYRIYVTGSYFSSEFIYVKADSKNKFKPIKTYAPGTFTDVPEGEWYAANVKSAYELDLVSGTSATTFSPNDNISVAATLTLAARIHSTYHTGQASFTQGDPWYQVYVDYAVKNNIIQAGQFSDYNANISRRDFAGIMCHAMPTGEFNAINAIEKESIPDVAEGSRYHDEIYTFYKAGISVGNDDLGTFTPEAAIQRSAAAALVTRMVDPSLRIKNIFLRTVVKPTKITLSKSELTVYTMESELLTASMEPKNCTLPVYWTSSDPAVATVSKSSTLDFISGSHLRSTDLNSVKAVAPGTAVLTATCGGVSTSITVTVEENSTPVGHPINMGYKRNSAGGISLGWSATNTSGKTVNYYSVSGTFLDNLGNPAKDSITGETTFALRNQGPIAPGEELSFGTNGNIVGYVPWCNAIRIDNILLEYSDGTVEFMNYGWKSTREFN